MLIIPPSPDAQGGEDSGKKQLNNNNNKTKSSGADAGGSRDHPDAPVFAAGCLLATEDLQHGCTPMTG